MIDSGFMPPDCVLYGQELAHKFLVTAHCHHILAAYCTHTV